MPVCFGREEFVGDFGCFVSLVMGLVCLWGKLEKLLIKDEDYF